MSWVFGFKAREASGAYEAAKGGLEVGFRNSSKAQIRAIEAVSPNLAALKRRAIRRWIITVTLQIAIFAAITALAILQD